MNATKAELLQSIKRNEGILALIDVRSPQQMKVQSKIENAVNISNIQCVQNFWSGSEIS